jgi:hypothetical protein
MAILPTSVFPVEILQDGLFIAFISKVELQKKKNKLWSIKPYICAAV